MTKPIITQADMDAAQAFFPEHLWKQQARDDIALAFAAHRLASERRAYEKAAGVAAEHADQCEDTNMGRRLNSLANDIAQAIRALATSPAPDSGEG